MSPLRSAVHQHATRIGPQGWNAALRSSVAALAACCCSAAAQAQAPTGSTNVPTLEPSAQPLLKATTRLSPDLNGGNAAPTAHLEQSLWAGRGHVNVGVQWQGRMQAYRPDARPVWNTAVYTGSDGGTMAMGMAVNLGERTRVELTRPLDNGTALRNASINGGSGAVAPGQGIKLALEVRPSNPVSGLRRGLRVELATNSTLTFRPRGGGLTVHYNSTF